MLDDDFTPEPCPRGRKETDASVAASVRPKPTHHLPDVIANSSPRPGRRSRARGPVEPFRLAGGGDVGVFQQAQRIGRESGQRLPAARAGLAVPLEGQQLIRCAQQLQLQTGWSPPDGGESRHRTRGLELKRPNVHGTADEPRVAGTALVKVEAGEERLSGFQREHVWGDRSIAHRAGRGGDDDAPASDLLSRGIEVRPRS